MATVYLAMQESLNREVALKILSPSLAHDEDFSERFLREAQIAGGFRHRHLIAVYDAGRVEENLYLAMEFVPGGSAADLRRGDPEDIRRCLIEVADALAYAHARGVVHRDIKPDNILRREDGSFVLSDFGIARSSEHAKQLTGPQAALGTPAYMSPEQWRNQPVDGRADLYALGIVAYELLTGSPPFAGADGLAIGMQHLQSPRPQLDSAFAAWQPVLDQLVAVAPEDRYPTAADLAFALGGSNRTPRTNTPQGASTVEILTPPSQRRIPPRMRWLGALALLLTLIAAGYFASRVRAPPADASQPAAQQATVPPVTQPAAPSKSIAVLPFRVLSDRPADELFADGLSEEILTTLAAIAELKVAGRTSSFAWRGKNADLRQIADALGVAHVLEGSVRRDGDQLRISATLVDARDGTTRWAANFDRRDDDAFAIQSEIATAVADRLSVSMGTRTLPTLARLPASERILYLQAIGLQRTGQPERLAEVRASLRQLIDAEDVGPDAILRLINVIAEMIRYQAFDIRYQALDAGQGRAEQAALTRQLAQRFPEAIERRIADALVLQSQADVTGDTALYGQALDIYREVLKQSPNDGLVAINGSHAARLSGQFEESIALSRKAIAIEPDDPVAQITLRFALSDAGQFDAAADTGRKIVEQWPDSAFARDIWPTAVANEGRLADALLLLGDCARNSAVDTCLTERYVLEQILDLPRAAVKTLAQMQARARTGRTEALIWSAIAQDALPDPSAVNRNTVDEAVGASLSEALARGEVDTFMEYGRRGFGEGFLSPEAAEPLIPRRSFRLVWSAMPVTKGAASEQWRARLQVLESQLRNVPVTAHTPSGTLAMMAALLLGDVDGAVKRLETYSTLSPLMWDRWFISPTGRDLPLMQVLRTHPSFDRIWANRSAVIARERARIRQLRPDIG